MDVWWIHCLYFMFVLQGDHKVREYVFKDKFDYKSYWWDVLWPLQKNLWKKRYLTVPVKGSLVVFKEKSRLLVEGEIYHYPLSAWSIRGYGWCVLPITEDLCLYKRSLAWNERKSIADERAKVESVNCFNNLWWYVPKLCGAIVWSWLLFYPVLAPELDPDLARFRELIALKPRNILGFCSSDPGKFKDTGFWRAQLQTGYAHPKYVSW